jgi:hypothetical protein
VQLLLQLRVQLLKMHAERQAKQQQQQQQQGSAVSSSSGSSSSNRARSSLTEEQVDRVMHTAVELHAMLSYNGDEQVALLSGATFPAEPLLESSATLYKLQQQQSDDVQMAARYALQYMRDVLQPDQQRVLERELSRSSMLQVSQRYTLHVM